METVTKLPEGFLDEFNLSGAHLEVYLEQINRFNFLRQKPIKNNDIILDEDGNIIFPEGTLINGVMQVSIGKEIDK